MSNISCGWVLQFNYVVFFTYIWEGSSRAGEQKLHVVFFVALFYQRHLLYKLLYIQWYALCPSKWVRVWRFADKNISHLFIHGYAPLAVLLLSFENQLNFELITSYLNQFYKFISFSISKFLWLIFYISSIHQY